MPSEKRQPFQLCHAAKGWSFARTQVQSPFSFQVRVISSAAITSDFHSSSPLRSETKIDPTVHYFGLSMGGRGFITAASLTEVVWHAVREKRRIEGITSILGFKADISALSICWTHEDIHSLALAFDRRIKESAPSTKRLNSMEHSGYRGAPFKPSDFHIFSSNFRSSAPTTSV